MSQSLSGVIMALDNVLALFLLPLFGTLSDKCGSKLGRRTPYIIFGTVMAAAFLVVLSFADNMQRRALDDVAVDNPTAQETLYDADLTVTTPDGAEVVIQEAFSREEFCAIELRDGEGGVNEQYTRLCGARPAGLCRGGDGGEPHAAYHIRGCAAGGAAEHGHLPQPGGGADAGRDHKAAAQQGQCRDKPHGAAGGIIVLLLGSVFGTGAPENALMSYTVFFAAISGLMLGSLLIFLWRVKEPALVREMHAESERLKLVDEAEEAAGDRQLQRAERTSLLLILASVVLWFFGYNAVTSKYSVYASSVLGLDYNATLTIATGAAIVAYIPVGAVASRFGRAQDHPGRHRHTGRLVPAGQLCAGWHLTHNNEHTLRHGRHRLGDHKREQLSHGGRALARLGRGQVHRVLLHGEHGRADGDAIFSGFLMDNMGMTVLFPLRLRVRAAGLCDHAVRAPRRQQTHAGVQARGARRQ